MIRAGLIGFDYWGGNPARNFQAARGATPASICESDRALIVDHTMVYSPAVRKIRQLLYDGEPDSLYQYDSVRTNLGRFRSDGGVLRELASHDLATLDDLLEEQPERVSARGAARCGAQDEVSHLSLEGASGFHAQVHVRWLPPVKVRRATPTGSKRMPLWNDLEDGPPQDDVRRAGERRTTRPEVSEPLHDAVDHFVHRAQTGEAPMTGGEAGLRVIGSLEKAAGL